MRRPLALLIAALVAILGGAVLAPPALPVSASLAAQAAPFDARLQLLAAQDSFVAENGTSGHERSKKAAAIFALRSVQAMPYNQPAFSLAIESGAVSAQTGAANLSAALGWRDALTNARIARLALTQSAPMIAAQRIDAIGRTQGGEVATTAADLLMALPGGPDALASRAGNRVGGLWWIVYLRQPATGAQAQEGRLAFARALDSDEGPWRRRIIEALDASMGGADVAGKRYDLWRDTLADSSLFVGGLYDTEFQQLAHDRTQLGGEWHTGSKPPFAVKRISPPVEAGLRLDSQSTRAGTVLAQTIFPQPGRYQFSAEGGVSSARLYWQTQCETGSPIFSSASAVGEWTFAVPANCGSMQLQLLAAEGDLEGAKNTLSRVSLEPVS